MKPACMIKAWTFHDGCYVLVRLTGICCSVYSPYRDNRLCARISQRAPCLCIAKFFPEDCFNQGFSSARQSWKEESFGSSKGDVCAASPNRTVSGNFAHLIENPLVFPDGGFPGKSIQHLKTVYDHAGVFKTLFVVKSRRVLESPGRFLDHPLKQADA